MKNINQTINEGNLLYIIEYDSVYSLYYVVSISDLNVINLLMLTKNTYYSTCNIGEITTLSSELLNGIFGSVL